MYCPKNCRNKAFFLVVHNDACVYRLNSSSAKCQDCPVHIGT